MKVYIEQINTWLESEPKLLFASCHDTDKRLYATVTGRWLVFNGSELVADTASKEVAILTFNQIIKL